MNSIEAIILEKRPFGESDELIVVYSKEKGKMILRARGVRKSIAKLVGPLQLFNWAQIYFVEGRGIPIITDTSLVESFSLIKNNVAKIKAVRDVSNIISKVMPELTFDYVVWWQFTDFLNTVERAGEKDKLFILAPAFFTYRLLNSHGFRAELARCISCGLAVSTERASFFSYSAGGSLCKDCLSVDPAAISLSAAANQQLRQWRTQELSEFLSITLTPKTQKELIRVVERFSQWHLGAPITFSL